MVQQDANKIVKNATNNSHPQSSGFANSFRIYTQPTKTNTASVASRQRNGVPVSSPSPRNLHNPNLHAFPNSFKGYADQDKNVHSTLHQSQSYPVFPPSLIDQPDRIAPPIDGRKSTPPDMQELLHSSWDRDPSVDCPCVINSSSSSPSPSSSGPLESQPPKKSYLDAALFTSNYQEPNGKPSLLNGFSTNSSSNSAAPQPPSSPSFSSTGSSFLRSQPSKDQTSVKSTAPVVPQSGSFLKPPTRSIIFGTFDASLLLPLASVPLRHLDSPTRLSRTGKSKKNLRVSTSCTTTNIASSASYFRVSVSGPLGKETVAPSSNDALKVTEGLDPMSGHVLGRCQSCNNPLKHCCRETINDILSGSRSP